MHDLKAKLIEKITTGLRHKSIKNPSTWATMYREMPMGKWKFDRFPWLKAMHDSKAEYNVGQKAAQMGFTETLLNLTFYCNDILGLDVLYVLPNKNPDCGDFSTGRFDPALELSNHIRNLYSDTNNVGHKRAGASNLYLRGSQSRSGLKSIPASRLFMDEVAEFVEKNISLAFERTSGQFERLVWMISTPTLPGFGISKYYEETNKQVFRFKCPGCSRTIQLDFPDNLIHLEEPDLCRLICVHCKKILEHEDKINFLANAFWEQTAKSEWNGFGVSQLYSTTVTPKALAFSYKQALNDEAHELEFYNSKIGVTREMKGARILEEEIIRAIGPHHTKIDGQPDKFYVLGVDVGKVCHYEVNSIQISPKDNEPINYYDINAYTNVVVEDFGKTTEIGDIDKLFNRFNIISAVIDANPERRMAIDFARRHPGRVRMCFFTRGNTGRSIVTTHQESSDEPFINVDRTAWLDLALGRFKAGTIQLPVDINLEYREHVKEIVKTYVKNDKGEYNATYVTAENKGDHYALARCYAEVAQSFIGTFFMTNDNITESVW